MTVNAAASAPMHMKAGRGDFVVVGSAETGIVVTIVDGITVTAGVITGDVGVEGRVSTILNVADPLTSWMIPLTLTIYSSGLNPVASMANDHEL